MVCLGFKPGAGEDKGWKAQMHPLSNGMPQNSS